MLGSFLIASLFLISCKKEVSELPPATETGANTFGCRVNGAFWVPAGFGVVPTASILEARYMEKNIIINARNFASSPVETEFEIYIQNVIAPGTYTINQASAVYPNQTASYAYYVKRKFTPENEWITNTQFTGSVNITKRDTVNNIISGTFTFQGQSMYNASETISITEGRFDIKVQ